MMKASLFLSSIGNGLCSPFFDSNQLLYAILQNDGEIIHIDESTGHVEVIHRTNGQPQSAIYENGIMYIADLALNSISNSNNSTILSSFEELPLKGPHSIIACNNRKYFTDSGPFGETGLHNPSGSIFSIIDNDFSKPIPISLNNLAFPTGIVFHNGCLYVAEMMGNRILRFTQKPEGVHHGSVFIQLSGSIGPSCLACDTIGNIYIGQFDFKGILFVYLIYMDLMI